MDILRYIFTNPIELGLIWAVFGLGVFVAFRLLDIADLSVESVMPLSAVITILLINAGVPAIVALLISCLAGVILGMITSSLSTFLKLPPLLSGIVMMTALVSFIVVLSNGYLALNQDKETIYSGLSNALIGAMGNVFWGNFLGTTIILLIVIAIVSGALYWFFGTNLGVAIRATGKNETMAKAQGINVDLMKIIGMAISSLLIALAGSLLGQYNQSITSTTGKGSIVIGLAIVFLGEVIFNPKTFKVHLIAVTVGGYVYWLLLSLILSIKGFNTSYQYALQAAIIVLVMVIPELVFYFKSKQNRKRRYRDVNIK